MSIWYGSQYVSQCFFLVAHVIEESHDAKDGIDFLTETRSDWEKSLFGGHITWHLTLHYFGMTGTCRRSIAASCMMQTVVLQSSVKIS